MRISLALMLFLSLFSAAAVGANSHTSDKIMTINRMTGDAAHPQNHCAAADNRILCTYTLYHYEIDGHGRLYFARVTAYGEKNSTVLQSGAMASILICQLNAALTCEMPELDNLPFDLSAYAASENGVIV